MHRGWISDGSTKRTWIGVLWGFDGMDGMDGMDTQFAYVPHSLHFTIKHVYIMYKNTACISCRSSLSLHATCDLPTPPSISLSIGPGHARDPKLSRARHQPRGLAWSVLLAKHQTNLIPSVSSERKNSRAGGHDDQCARYSGRYFCRGGGGCCTIYLT